MPAICGGPQIACRKCDPVAIAGMVRPTSKSIAPGHGTPPGPPTRATDTANPVGGPRPFSKMLPAFFLPPPSMGSPTGLRHFPHPCGSRDPAAIADMVRSTSKSIAPGRPSHKSRRHRPILWEARPRGDSGHSPPNNQKHRAEVGPPTRATKTAFPCGRRDPAAIADVVQRPADRSVQLQAWLGAAADAVAEHQQHGA